MRGQDLPQEERIQVDIWHERRVLVFIDAK